MSDQNIPPEPYDPLQLIRPAQSFFRRHRGWVVACIAISSVGYCVQRQSTLTEQQRISAERACLESIECQDDKARSRSKHLHVDTPVRSTTGNLFFKGYQCTENCMGHISGYQWASLRGISKTAGCPTTSISFYEGCIAYVEYRRLGFDD